MAMRITHVRLAFPEPAHEAIAWLRWRNEADGTDGESATSTLVRYVEGGGEVVVGDGTEQLAVRVVRPDAGDPFLQAYAGERPTNHLIELPTF